MNEYDGQREQGLELHVYVEAGCQSCERAVALAEEVDGAYPQLAVQVVNIAEPSSRPEEVFAVPTFVLDGRVLSLGNPQPSELRQQIESVLEQRDIV